jgi:hypothetical protein
MQFQRARGLSGDLLEIGVYHGRYFIPLMQELGPREIAVAIDVFQSWFGDTDPLLGDYSVFTKNLRRYAPDVRRYVLETDSLTLTANQILVNTGDDADPHPFRFISIDGAHDYEHALHDLLLAHAMLATGGIVALDDWAPEGNEQWPEVARAEVAFQALQPGSLLHIGSIPNKLLLTNDAFWMREYQTILRDWRDSDESEEHGTSEDHRRTPDDGTDGDGTDDHRRDDHHHRDDRVADIKYGDWIHASN